MITQAPEPAPPNDREVEPDPVEAVSGPVPDEIPLPLNYNPEHVSSEADRQRRMYAGRKTDLCKDARIFDPNVNNLPLFNGKTGQRRLF